MQEKDGGNENERQNEDDIRVTESRQHARKH